ncbi:MAG TPA: hypothetical protein VJH20_02395 [Candidatus Nanoarchaeia archaeon]|nr:hypothetical protein [Candidatus Nanoarchaeia archaeon]
MSENVNLGMDSSVVIREDVSSLSLLGRIRQILAVREDVHNGGEVPFLVKRDLGSFYLLEDVTFFVAPVEPDYDDASLSEFTEGLFPDIEPDNHPFMRKFKKYEYMQYGSPYWTLHFGDLEFSEDIGILQVIIQATHYILHDHESANRWSINTSIHGNVEEKPIRRKIFVNVFPERELADLMYRYCQFYFGLPRETILGSVALDRIGKENIPRRFDSLRSHIDTYDYNYLCSGKLRGDLEVVLEKHSGK